MNLDNIIFDADSQIYKYKNSNYVDEINIVSRNLSCSPDLVLKFMIYKMVKKYNKLKLKHDDMEIRYTFLINSRACTGDSEYDECTDLSICDFCNKFYDQIDKIHRERPYNCYECQKTSCGICVKKSFKCPKCHRSYCEKCEASDQATCYKKCKRVLLL